MLSSIIYYVILYYYIIIIILLNIFCSLKNQRTFSFQLQLTDKYGSDYYHMYGFTKYKKMWRNRAPFFNYETFCWWCFCFLECYSEVPIGQSNGAMLILTYLAMLSAVMNEKPNWVLSETQYILCSHSVGVAPVTVPIGMVRWQYTHTCTDLTVISR